MARAGVGAEGEEQIRVAGHVDALVGLGAALPFLVQPAAVQTLDRKRRAAFADVEAGGEHDAIQLVLDAVRGADAVRRQPRDRPGDQLGVVFLQGRVIVVGDQHPFAADAEVRGQLPAHPVVFHLVMQVRQAEALGHAGQRRVPDHRHGHGFVGPEQRLAHRLLAGGHFLEQLLVPVRRFEIRTRHHPARRALEHFQLAHGFYQLRNNLNAAGAGADHRHALAGEIVVVVPARAVNLLAFEFVQAFDVREAGVGQRPLGHHRGAAAHHLAFFKRGFP